MTESALARLLAPVTPEEFLERYWQQRPLHIRGTPDKLADVFDRAAFDHAVAEADERGVSIRVSFDGTGFQKGVGLHFPISSGSVAQYLSRQATICVDPIEQALPALADYAATLKRELHHAGPVSVKAYLSADGCGFNAHFDHQIATTLQIAGRKRWRFSAAPSVLFPRENGFLSRDGEPRYVHSLPSTIPDWGHLGPVNPDDFTEVVLEPGDVLSLPAGFWHEAKAMGSSLAINISFSSLDFFTLLASALPPLLHRDSSWRQSIPAALGELGADRAPPAVAQFFTERLSELHDRLAELTADSQILGRTWHAAIRGELKIRDRTTGFSQPGGLFGRPAIPMTPPTSPSPPQPDPDHGGAERILSGELTATLGVRDLNAAIEWYCGTFGFTIRYRMDRLHWCELAIPGTGVSLGLSEIRSAGNSTAAGPPDGERRGGDDDSGTRLVLGVVDIDGVRARLEAMNVAFDGPTQVLHGVVKLAPFRDPDGNRLILSQRLA
jgi:ribosomal protein L16 Arg81 hydroxylase/catechol 2,3-dioxygenase-like lactoylglutathione lyase family enzyme